MARGGACLGAVFAGLFKASTVQLGGISAAAGDGRTIAGSNSANFEIASGARATVNHNFESAAWLLGAATSLSSLRSKLDTNLCLNCPEVITVSRSCLIAAAAALMLLLPSDWVGEATAKTAHQL